MDTHYGGKRLTKTSTRNLIFIFLLEFVFCDYHYERTEQLLLQTEFKTIQRRSAVGCCAYCSHTTGCESVSFKPSEGECRLSSVPSSAIQQDGTTSLEWNTYSLKLGNTTSYDSVLDM